MANEQDRSDAWSGVSVPSEEELSRLESGALWPASPPARPEQRPQLPTGVIAILVATFDAYASTLGRVLPISTAYATVLALLPDEAGVWGILYGLFGALVTAVLIRLVGSHLRGMSGSISGGLRAALGRFLPLFGWDILMGLGIAVLTVIAAIVVALPVVLTMSIAQASPDLPPVAAGAIVGVAVGIPVGLACLAVIARWALAPAAIVLDGMGPIEGSSESVRLTRRRITGIVALLFVALVLTSIGSIGALLIPIATPDIGAVEALVLEVALLAVTFPILPTLAAVLYTRLDRSAVATPAPAMPRQAAVGAALGMALVLGVASAASGGSAVVEQFQAVAGAAGQVRFGTAGEECVLESVATTFTVGDPIYLVAVPGTAIEAGDTIEIQLFLDGELVDWATTDGQDDVACLYGALPSTFLPTGHYRIEYARGSDVLAEGEFDLIAP